MLLKNRPEITCFLTKIKSYPQYGIIDSSLGVCTMESQNRFIDKNLRYLLNQREIILRVQLPFLSQIFPVSSRNMLNMEFHIFSFHDIGFREITLPKYLITLFFIMEFLLVII